MSDADHNMKMRGLYVTDDVEMKINPNDDLARALLPLCPARHPKTWWSAAWPDSRLAN